MKTGISWSCCLWPNCDSLFIYVLFFSLFHFFTAWILLLRLLLLRLSFVKFVWRRCSSAFGPLLSVAFHDSSLDSSAYNRTLCWTWTLCKALGLPLSWDCFWFVLFSSSSFCLFFFSFNLVWLGQWLLPLFAFCLSSADADPEADLRASLYPVINELCSWLVRDAEKYFRWLKISDIRGVAYVN